MVKQIIENYLQEIYEKIARGDAREESYYGALEKFIFSLGQSLNKKTAVTTLPKKSEAGNPDFRIWDGQSQLVGYIEAKNPSVNYLDEIEASEQLRRYIEAYPNILLTNFFEFRLYRNGVLWDKPVKISDYTLSQRLPKFPIVQHEEELIRLLTFFFDFVQPRITSSKTLAEVLADKAGIMRDYVVVPTIEEGKENYFSWLYQSFQKHLIRDLKPQDFADLFSQTFTYGLLIAKYDYESRFTLFGKKPAEIPFITKTAYDFIQKNFGILREVFKIISTQDMPQNLEVITDDIIDILNHTEIYKILSQTAKSGKKDPIFHLYETFLLKYDRERKKKLGVYYTPLEVVTYIVNSVHQLLKDNNLFNAPDGLASFDSNSVEKSITLLDPAVGTGTFYVSAIGKALDEVKNKYSSSSEYLSKFIRSHILSHFFAFEILIAPYVVSHLKVLFTLTDQNFVFNDKDILRIFLTNTLEFHHKEVSGFPGVFEQTLVSEQKNAIEVKNKTPIQIVIGNPPYSVSSQNEVDKETEFGKFYESYKENVRKEEKNIQPLSDDYIKFLAFAHWKVKQAGKGIVGMITNNSYLDGLIHRDMRKKLLEDFDLIYILNLHGDTKRPLTTKDGKSDENVFDIRQGVAINILVKPEKPAKKQVLYAELIELRENKYHYLDTHNVKTSDWQELKSKEPYWFFVPKDFGSEGKYESFVSLTQIFDKNSSGVKTHRDHFVIGFTEKEMIQRINTFISELPDALIKETFRLDESKGWSISNARQSVKQTDWDKKIYPYSYKPFDERYICYLPDLIDRDRRELMLNLLEENLGLVVRRTAENTLTWRQVFISKNILDINYLSAQTYIFPLWIYETDKKFANQQTLLSNTQEAIAGRRSNIKQDFVKSLSSAYNQITSPEEIFYYIYAVLYSKIYREQHEEFLKIDFPKIPFTKDYQLFKQVSKLGRELADLHLLKNTSPNKSSSRFEGDNGDFIKKVYYNAKQKRIYTNEKQYFTNVEPEVWNYYIGGYQVLDKWLKDRNNKSLSSEEINHYIKIIEAIKQTIKIQSQIDKIYPEVEKRIIEKT